MTKHDDELAALKARVEELERAAKPPEKSDFVPKTDAEWIDEMHQMRERRMSMATPPSVVRDLTVIPDHIVKGIVQDRHAPTSATGMIPSSQQRADVHVGGKSSTPGYADPRPLGKQPGIDLIDRAVNAALPHGPEWGKKGKDNG